MLSQLTPLLFYFHVTHPCIPERCPEAFRAVSPPRFLDGCTKFHVPSVHRAPSLPTHLHLNLSPALRTPGWHILSERKGRTFLTRLWPRVESIYGGAGGAEFSTLDWCVCFKSTVGSCGGGGSATTHAHTHTHSFTLARAPCPPGSRPACPGYSSPFFPGAPARLTRSVPRCHRRRLRRGRHCWRWCSRPQAPLGASPSFSTASPAPN